MPWEYLGAYLAIGVLIFGWALLTKKRKRLTMLGTCNWDMRIGIGVLSIVLWPLVAVYSIRY